MQISSKQLRLMGTSAVDTVLMCTWWKNVQSQLPGRCTNKNKQLMETIVCFYPGNDRFSGKFLHSFPVYSVEQHS